MKLEDVKGDDAIGAREYRGRIFRILKSENINSIFFFIEEYKKPIIFFWMKPSWRRWRRYCDQGWYPHFRSEEYTVTYYKEEVDRSMFLKEKTEVIIPLTADDKVIKDIIE